MNQKNEWDGPERRIDQEKRDDFDSLISMASKKVYSIEETGEEWQSGATMTTKFDFENPDSRDEQRIVAGNTLKEFARKHGPENVRFVKEEDGKVSVYFRKVFAEKL